MSNQQTADTILAAALDVEGAVRAREKGIAKLRRIAEGHFPPPAVTDEIAALLGNDQTAEAQRRILAWLEESDGVRQ